MSASKIQRSMQVLQKPVRNCSRIWTEKLPSLKEDANDLEFILHSLKNVGIEIKPKNKNLASDRINSDETDSDSCLKDIKSKKRGRPPKTSTLLQDRLRSESSESVSLDDSVSSSTSNRSRRAAAQAADQKLAQVQSFIKATKLRRPTDFDEKQIKRSNIVSSPPAKCRKTHQYSAGHSPKEVVNSEVIEVEDFGKETVVNKTPTNNRAKSRSLERPLLVSQRCTVDLTRMNTPEVNTYTNRVKSRSLERPLKRKSEDLFNDGESFLVVTSKKNNKEYIIEKTDQKSSDVDLTEALSESCHTKNKQGRRKKLKSKKDPDSGISSNGGEVNEVEKENLPLSHSSPIPGEIPTSEEFKGFSIPEDANVTKIQTVMKENTFVIVDNLKTNSDICELVKCVETERCVITKTESENGQEKCDEIEINSVKSRTRRLRSTRKLEEREKENEQENKEDIGKNTDDDLSAVRSRTRVITKVGQSSEANQKIEAEVQGNGLVGSDLDEREKSPEANTRRTKIIRKNTLPSDSSGEESNLRSRTKTIKKGVQSHDVIEDVNSKYLASKFKEQLVPINKQNKTHLSELSESPGFTRGEVVKKRVEDFEKLKNGTQVEEKIVGRCTRNTAKNKAVSSATEPQSSKKNQNISNGKLLTSASKALGVDKEKSTPLGTNNKMTPNFGSNSRNHAVNKVLTSVETAKAVVQKQVSEEAERKKREEERIRREAKEEEAKKKKEITLKATTEKKRRNREEHFNKVVAKKEAAEKEKALAAAKAEKEKEEKLRLIEAEKQKAREEHLKKKLLLQQKALEHEERRKQEEAARLAKLKEQEEEHKRALAMKEREQEIQKLQKATDLKVAEGEKTKNQNSKLAKQAALNNAKLRTQQGNATVTKQVGGPDAVQSYELTPARDDRPLLKPKSENDYGIDDANSSDSSEDESRPKKQIPKWAQAKNRTGFLLTHKYIPKKIWTLFMQADRRPDISKLFAGNPIRKRIRTSSAVWNTPPKLD